MREIDTKIETMHIVQYADLNGAEKLFGGRLMEWMDEAAVLSAMKFCRSKVVTGTVDSLVFYSGAEIADVILICAQVTCVTKSTMEVRVRVHVQHMNGEKELINKAYFVMVLIPDKETGVKPRLPELELTTEEGRAEWENGMIRSHLRNERRREDI